MINDLWERGRTQQHLPFHQYFHPTLPTCPLSQRMHKSGSTRRQHCIICALLTTQVALKVGGVERLSFLIYFFSIFVSRPTKVSSNSSQKPHAAASKNQLQTGPSTFEKFIHDFGTVIETEPPIRVCIQCRIQLGPQTVGPEPT